VPRTTSTAGGRPRGVPPHDGPEPTPDPEPVEPTVRELLLARIDEHRRLLGLELDQVAKATEQLAPQRARSCRNAITMAAVRVDKIRLRAHARPLDETT